MKRTVSMITGLVLGGLLVGLLGAQSSSRGSDPSITQSIARLSADINALTRRIERLEHATDSYYEDLTATSTGDAPDVSSAAGHRYMRVDSIQQVQFTGHHADEIERLNREIAALERTVQQQRQRLSNAERRRGGGSNSRDVEAQIATERRLLNQYNQQLSRTRNQLSRVERSASEPKQIIHGHEGDAIITLETEADLSSSLGDVTVGDAVTWKGNRVEMERGAEVWIVETISKLD